MAHDRDERIVAFGRKRDDLRAERGDDRSQTRQVGVGRLSGGCQHPRGPLEHLTVSAVEPLELRPGHRVTADEASIGDGRHDRGLHGADVGDEAHRIYREHRSRHVGNLRHGHRDERDAGRRVDPGFVDDPRGQSPRDAPGVDVVAAHPPASLSQRERQRPADEPQSDDACSVWRRGRLHIGHGGRRYRSPAAQGQAFPTGGQLPRAL